MTFADLHRTIQSAIAGKRIGTPVFVRCTLVTASKDHAPLPTLIRLATASAAWIGQPVEQAYVLGKAEGGQVTALMQYRQAGCAQISVARTASGETRLDLMILGNQGALYHDGIDTGELAKAAADDKLQALLERALQSGKPESAGEGKP